VTVRKLSLRNIGLIRPSIAVFCTLIAAPGALAAEGWQSALAKMPLGGKVTELNRSNCVSVMLGAFQSSDAVKALVFMPGATDEFYMFKRAKARLTMGSPSLLDAVEALTNQTLIHVTFRPPLLLLHTDEDPLEPVIRLEHQPTVKKLQRTGSAPGHSSLCWPSYEAAQYNHDGPFNNWLIFTWSASR
jgi:hypothetical protein